MHLLGGAPAVADKAQAASPVPLPGETVALGDVAALRANVAQLTTDVTRLKATVARLCRELGIAEEVRFLGARPDKAELLGACDLFALASRLEGLGVAALEAMAAGRPVLASRVGGLAEAVVDGSTGVLVEPEDDEGLARALARLRDDPDLRARFGKAGTARIAEGFLPEHMVASYERLYREVLAESSA